MSTLSSNKLNNISRFLIKILRHSAKDHNLDIDKDGFILVDDLLGVEQLKLISIKDIEKIVETCEKKRFTLKKEKNKCFIAANQGHSIKISSSLLKPITLENYSKYNYANVIHGSYLIAKNRILKQGLSRMNRYHIHFTSEINNKKVVSGMRNSCEIYVYIDILKALNDGYLFFQSPNGVILSPGNSSGFIPPEYIIKIVDKKDLN